MTNRETWRIKSKPGDLTGLGGDELMEISSCKHVLDFFLDLLTHLSKFPPFILMFSNFMLKIALEEWKALACWGKLVRNRLTHFSKVLNIETSHF